MTLDNIISITNDFFKSKGVEKVNEGHCYHWSYLISCFIFCSLITHDFGHAFLKVGNQYIDCDGFFDQWYEIDFFIYWSIEEEDGKLYTQSNEEFISYWQKNGLNGWDHKLIDAGLKYINDRYKVSSQDSRASKRKSGA